MAAGLLCAKPLDAIACHLRFANIKHPECHLCQLPQCFVRHARAAEIQFGGWKRLEVNQPVPVDLGVSQREPLEVSQVPEASESDIRDFGAVQPQYPEILQRC